MHHGDGVEALAGPGRVPSHEEEAESQEREEEEERKEERTQQDLSAPLRAGERRRAVVGLVPPLVAGLAPADVDQGRAGQAQPALD